MGAHSLALCLDSQSAGGIVQYEDTRFDANMKMIIMRM